MIVDYNKGKAGADAMDQNVDEFSVKRKTARWPLLFFYNMLDVAINNSYIISRKTNYNGGRCKFMKDVSFGLAEIFANNRLKNKKLQRHIISAAIQVGYTVPLPLTQPIGSNKSGRCKYCGKVCRSS